jgi:thioredoxin 1
MIEELNTAGFQADLTRDSLPVLVDFWAPWCGPCRVQLPILERLASAPEAGYRIAKVNVDEQEQLAVNYQVASIPTLILFRDGKPVRRLVGLQSEESLRSALQDAATASAA